MPGILLFIDYVIIILHKSAVSVVPIRTGYRFGRKSEDYTYTLTFRVSSILAGGRRGGGGNKHNNLIEKVVKCKTA